MVVVKDSAVDPRDIGVQEVGCLGAVGNHGSVKSDIWLATVRISTDALVVLADPNYGIADIREISLVETYDLVYVHKIHVSTFMRKACRRRGK